MQVKKKAEAAAGFLMKHKNAGAAYVLNALALLPLLCFGFPHFTADSYLVAADYAIHENAFLGAFRYFGALLIRLRTALSDPVRAPLPDALFFVLLTALSVTALTLTVCAAGRLRGTLCFAVVDLSVLIAAANFFLIDVLCFPEDIFLTACGIFLCFSALIVFFREKGSAWIRYPIAGLLLVAATAVYQQFLTVFLVFAFLLLALRLLREPSVTVKKAFFVYLGFACFTAVCAAAYYGIGIGVQKLLGVSPNPRAALSAAGVLDGIRYYLTHQRGILGGKGYFETPLLRRCFEALALLWGISVLLRLKKRKFDLRTALILPVFPLGYAAVFLVGAISEPGGVRVIMGLFSVFALFAVGALALSGRSRPLACCLAALLVLVFGLNIYKDLETYAKQATVNANELVLARQYLGEIERYEAETGETVRNVVFCADDAADAVAPPAMGKTGASALTYDWGVSGILHFVSGGRGFSVRACTDAEKEAFFGGKNWTYYVPSEQLRFEKDTLYFCLY